MRKLNLTSPIPAENDSDEDGEVKGKAVEGLGTILRDGIFISS